MRAIRRPPEGVPRAEWSQVPRALQQQILSAADAMQWPIVLIGHSGVGKTFAAACLYRAAESAIWWDCQKLLRLMVDISRSTAGYVELPQRDGSTRQIWRNTLLLELATTDMLVLDDIGLRAPSPAQYDALREILNDRTGKPLVVTSNLNAGQLANTYDDRIVSRLAAGRIIAVQGEDRRIQNKIVTVQP